MSIKTPTYTQVPERIYTLTKTYTDAHIHAHIYIHTYVPFKFTSASHYFNFIIDSANTDMKTLTASTDNFGCHVPSLSIKLLYAAFSNRNILKVYYTPDITHSGVTKYLFEKKYCNN